MYKVFVLGKPIILADSSMSINHLGERHIQPVNSCEALQKAIHIHKTTDVPETVIVAQDIEQLWNWFMADYELIEAAGGAVVNSKNQILCIFRNGKWDLPKGKLEKGERIENCAIREVEEECGITGVEIKEHLVDTYHTYTTKGQQLLKRTCWYRMSANSNQELVPQTEEGIEKVEWKKLDDLDEILANTYGSIADVISYLLPQ